MDAINAKRLPDACVKPIATRQTAHHLHVLEPLHRLKGNDLYDVYHVRNECAKADLSVLVGVKPWRSRIILMAGTFEGGHPLKDEDDYLDDGEDGDYDQLIERDKYHRKKDDAQLKAKHK
ncbi:hypothetical protein AAVH_22465 [Aphelenchoides avenae]|nr:hypothetical protein AAVH_22465 [Aphelenchus avenae]